MNTKYNTYDNLDKLKCIENEEIIKIDKKFENFSIDNNYNYAINIVENKNALPNINIDFKKLISYFKSTKDSVDNLTKEIALFNDYYKSLTKWVDMSKCESIKEKSIVYYLFYFMNRCFFYIIMNNECMCSEKNKNIFYQFFENFVQILATSKLYLEEDIENSSIIIDDDNNNNEKPADNNILINVKKGLYGAYEEIKNIPNEFIKIVTNCHNFISLVLFSVDQRVQIDEEEEDNIIDENMLNLLHIFVTAFNILHEVNEYYSIIDYKQFYNDSISKYLNMGREFKKYLKRLKQIHKEKEKNKKEGDKLKDHNNDIICDDVLKDDDDDEDMNNNDKIEFSLFDYIWLFSPSSKNEIIHLFNRMKQKNEAEKIFNRDRDRILLDLDINKCLCILNVRREHLIEDTLNEVSKPKLNLRNELKVKFKNEQGVDEGGVRKEFFILLIRQIFDPNYGMFSYNKKTRLYWFNHYSFEPKIKYELIGIIFGLAIYNNTILDVKLPMIVYKKLLGIKPSLEDMKECDPELYHTLNYLKNTNDDNLKEEIDTNFTVIDDKFGEKLVQPLKENGENIMIDNNNKDEYVDLYINWYFNESIKDFYSSFEKGFYRVFDKNLSKILTPEELELILCGTQLLDFNELKMACQYEEYEKDSCTIKYLWEILLDFNEEEKKKFLSFVTGCDRAPIDGLSALPITISNGGSDLNHLPTAHTCFNNLILPDYKDKEKMKKAILTAINYSEGFGLI